MNRKESNKKYYEKNKEKLIANNKQYSKEHYEERKEKVREASRRYYYRKKARLEEQLKDEQSKENIEFMEQYHEYNLKQWEALQSN